MTHYHAVVWIDHHQARIYHFNAEDIEALRVLPENPHVHLHHHRGSITDGHAQEDQHYYHPSPRPSPRVSSPLAEPSSPARRPSAEAAPA